MTKIVYNACYGGFSLSDKATIRYAELKGLKAEKVTGKHWSYWRIEGMDDWDGRGIDRADPVLVQVVEELGPDADGDHASLVIRELAPGTRYRIDEYDGNERVVTIDEYEWRTA